jgi:hypothetical protein
VKLRVVEWQEAIQLIDTAEQSTMVLSPMLVLIEEQSHGKSGQHNWSASVSPVTKQDSYESMSRQSAPTHPSAQALCGVTLEEEIILRTRQRESSVNENNPQARQQERASRETEYSASRVSLGVYLYGVLILLGLLVHDHTERYRKRCMRGNQIEQYRPSYCLSRLIREWLRVENFRLAVLMIGVAACVPTGFSTMVYSKQTVIGHGY